MLRLMGRSAALTHGKVAAGGIRGSVLRSLALWFLVCVPGSTQVLQILPAPPDKAGGTLYIMMVASAEKPVAAVQFRIASADGAPLTIQQILPGSAVSTAGKQIICAPAPGGDPPVQSYSCVVAGGRQPLLDGPVAIVRFAGSPRLQESRAVLLDVLGASPDGTRVEFPVVIPRIQHRPR